LVVCKACGYKNSFKNFAIQSPWVAELIGVKPQLVEYLICDHCGTGNTNLDFSVVQLRKLYSNYRGENYFATRNSWEPFYDNSLNASLSDSPDWMKVRRDFISQTLIRVLGSENCSRIRNVVDIGGGHGHLFPDFSSKQKQYVIDLDESPLDGAITKLTNFDTIPSLNIDLTMACGRLEHLVNPVEYSRILVSKLQKDSFIFFEVPSGVPTSRGLWKTDTSKRILLMISRNKKLYRTILILERYLKNSSFFLRLFPMRISEHLQFFTERGLFLLCRSVGIEVIESGVWNINATLPGSKSMGFQNGVWIVGRVNHE